MAAKEGVSLLLLQEPYVGATRKLDVAGFRVFQGSSSGQPTKAAIVVLDDRLRASSMPDCSTHNMVGVKISMSGLEVGVLSIYLEGDSCLDEDLPRLREVKTALQADHYIVGGDVNAKSPWWGCDTEDLRGVAISEFVAQESLQIMNEGTTPTFSVFRQGRHYSSIVDITMASDRLAPRVVGWRVDPLLSNLSDHCPIMFGVRIGKGPVMPPRPTTRRYNTVKADWELFDDGLAASLRGHELTPGRLAAVSSADELDELVTRVTDSVEAACVAAIPPVSICGRRAETHWWTAELGDLRTATNRLRNRIRNSNSERRQHVIERYLAARKEYKEAIQEAITRSWRGFCGRQEKESVWDGIYRVIRRSGESKPDELLRDPTVNGATLTPLASAKLLAETFYPLDREETDTPRQRTLRAEVERSLGLLKGIPLSPVDFTATEVWAVLRHMSPRKTPGGDGLSSDICSRVMIGNPVLVLSLFNACLRLGHFPRLWKRAVIRIVPKPGKESYADAKSYRPIGLLPVFGKVLEKMFATRLLWGLGSKSGLSPRQFGFMPQRSTEDALYEAVGRMRDLRDRRKLVVVISLDIEGAFDNAWWPGVVGELISKNTEPSILRLLTSYLSEREVTVQYAGSAVTVETNKGCIQGSTCGPLLWNVQLDPLLRAADGLKAHVQAFADDILVVASGDTTEELRLNAQEALEAIVDWGKNSKMRFAAHKTQAIFITRRLEVTPPDLMLEDTAIHFRESIKVLGLIIDRRLLSRST